MSGNNSLRKRKSTQSLRNELNEEEREEYEKYVETDFEKWSKEDLEAEVKALRKQMWKNHQSMNEDLRDMLSHGATGRAMDSADADLQLNQTAADGEKKKLDINAILAKAGKRALGGGTSGAISMVVTVFSLMWLRTTMNYQYRHGTSTSQAMRHLFKEGGIPRFYRGLPFALIQGPMSRFGDTAANTGTLALLDEFENTKQWPTALKTACASTAAAGWRMALMPVDACKTTMQVEGSQGLALLANKVKLGGPQVLWHGAFGAFGATWAGFYPWFFVHNYLQEAIPRSDHLPTKFARNAFIGFCSSVCSDCVSNSIRVVKTTKQTFDRPIGYGEAVKHVVDKDGVIGLFTRGLGTRILANGCQSMMFTMLWKGMDEYMKKNKVGFYKEEQE